MARQVCPPEWHVGTLLKHFDDIFLLILTAQAKQHPGIVLRHQNFY